MARTAGMTREEHVTTNVACAFLDEEKKSCTVYALRPHACRAHHSYDVMPCKETFGDPSSLRQPPMSAQIRSTAANFMAVATLEARRIGVDYARCEMNGAILAALMDPSAAQRWREGQAAFPQVRDRDATGGVFG